MDSLTALSPIDGRYAHKTRELVPYFSEFGLMRYRVMIEIEYFIALSEQKNIVALPQLSPQLKKLMRSWYQSFSHEDAEYIKRIEKTTRHDIKAVEYFIKEQCKGTKLAPYTEFVHFALTSADVNNLAYVLIYKHALERTYLPLISALEEQMRRFAKQHAAEPMLALTHGQSATPTTVGKEYAVFYTRLRRQTNTLRNQTFKGKLNGACGTWAAHHFSYPDINWVAFTKRFVSSLGLSPNLYTTQIEGRDSLAESYHNIIRINNILLDFARDMWQYISRGIFVQKKSEKEVGSSTMPHKINPIAFENAEGNLGLANTLLSHMASKLTISRMQRDLSGSTVIRNQGVALGHSILAYKNLIRGIKRVSVNTKKTRQELNKHWEILAEPIQTALRKSGTPGAYEIIKKVTRGQHINESNMKYIIGRLDIQMEEKQKLLQLTPEQYTGLAKKLVDLL